MSYYFYSLEMILRKQPPLCTNTTWELFLMLIADENNG